MQDSIVAAAIGRLSLINVVSVITGTSSLYLLCLAIYRLYLCPIANFPGPTLAALSFWYEYYYDVHLGGQYMFKIKELHEQYGPIIRINPYELHVIDPDFYDVLYSGPTQKRDKWWWSASMFGNSDSILFTGPHDLHRLRRSALNPFFSKQAISRMEPVIRELIDKLCLRFEQLRETGEVLNIDKAYAALTTDVITGYCFDTSYGCINDPDWKYEWPTAMIERTKSSHIYKQFKWLFPLMKSSPKWLVSRISPATSSAITFQQNLAKQIASIASSPTPQSSPTTNKTSTNTNTTSATTNTTHHPPTILHALLHSPTLPHHERTPHRLMNDSQTLIAAGQETTTFHLTLTTYHILSQPHTILPKLLTELRSSIPNPSQIPPLPTLQSLPYLTACINEGHRLSFGAVGRLQRISPVQHLHFGEYTIPPGTPVSMSSYHQHLNPTIFPDPHTFNPDRWLLDPTSTSTSTTSTNLTKYLVPFSKGTRACIAINLATAELYLTLATIFRRFGESMTLYETGPEEVKVVADYFIPHVRAGGQGVRVRF